MTRALVLPLLLLLVATFLVVPGPHASADELILNGGFESGLSGWAGNTETTQLEIVPQAHSGSQAVRISSGEGYDAEIWQIVPIAPNQPYFLEAWVVMDDPDIDKAFVRIRWLDSLETSSGPTQDGGYIDHSLISYQPTQTQLQISPSYAVAARISVMAVSSSSASFSFLVDDVSLQGPTPPPMTPTPVPTPTPTPVLPTKTPTLQPTVAPVTKTPTPTPKPTPKPTPTPTPKPTPAPPSAPLVFSTLTNGGFEQAGTDDAPFGWRKIGGEIRQVTSPVRSGNHSLQLRSSTTSTKWAFETVAVTSGAYYSATAYARNSDPDTDAIFLRVSWYATADGSGEAISSVDSQQLLDTQLTTFRLLSTGPVLAPAGAKSARIRLMLRPRGSGEAFAYFDDVLFEKASVPPTFAPPPTTAPATPGETDPPQGATPTPKPTLTPAPTFSPPPEEDDESAAFPALTNGGFEDVREDGTPYGWHKNGGEFASDDALAAEGSLALLMRSDTSSTKWVYQAVSVSGGQWYELAGFAAAQASGSELFLRLSWYSSTDGSGGALSSVDSVEPVVGPTNSYHYVTTGSVQAPGNARSARLRLMMRPSSSAQASAYFDALTFRVTTAPPPGFPGGSSGNASIGNQSGSVGQEEPSATGNGAESDKTNRPSILGAAATPVNVTNSNGDREEVENALTGNGGGNRQFWIWLAISVPLVGIGAIGAVEARRWAQKRRRE